MTPATTQRALPTFAPFSKKMLGSTRRSHYAPASGNRIAMEEVVKYLNMSWYAIAKAVGIAHPTQQVWSWRQGVTRPSSETWCRIVILLMLKTVYGWSTDRLKSIDWEQFLATSRTIPTGSGGNVPNTEG